LGFVWNIRFIAFVLHSFVGGLKKNTGLCDIPICRYLNLLPKVDQSGLKDRLGLVILSLSAGDDRRNGRAPAS
jgi:hypothetical protein